LFAEEGEGAQVQECGHQRAESAEGDRGAGLADALAGVDCELLGKQPGLAEFAAETGLEGQAQGTECEQRRGQDSGFLPEFHGFRIPCPRR
jgi:hypothetical protein